MLQYIYSFFEEEKMVFIKLLDGIDKNWSTIEKAKYLYNQIGKNTSYDERFAYGDDAELMHKIFYRDVDIKKTRTQGLCAIQQIKFIYSCYKN